MPAPVREREPLFRWNGDLWWPTRRGVRWLYSHYNCCLRPRRWCGEARGSRETEKLTRMKGSFSDPEEMILTEIKVSLDDHTARLTRPLLWGARTQRAHGPGNREYIWLADRAMRAGISVRAARARITRACRTVSRKMRGLV